MGHDAPDSNFKLQDRTAVITGPCNTTNQSIAMKLTQMGVNIALLDRNIEKSKRFADQLMDQREVQDRFGRAVAIQCDLAKPHHVQDSVSRAAETFGGIDIYVDGLMSTEVRNSRDANALDELDRMLDVNLRAPIMVTHAVMRFLEGRKRGRIIYLMHDIGRMGLPFNGLMAATRSGLSAYARTLSRELAELNITVNCVAIGVTEEFLLSQTGQEQISIQEAQSRLSRLYPHATMTEPERIANTIAFLASPLGAGITGQTIAVSQGLSLTT